MTDKINYILKYQLIILVGIFIILEGLLGYHLYKTINQQSKNIENKIIQKVPTENNKNIIYKRIDGTAVIDKSNMNLWPVAVMIDNHFDAWPNYGLGEASVVYETLVEGNFTRFLAFYTPKNNTTETINKIGPVRSVRPYFLRIVQEYNAMLAHAGGSPKALQEIKDFKINNLEEIAWWGPDYFWRVYSRSAPHNLFTSGNKLAQAVIDWELAENIPNYRAWKFSNTFNTKKLSTADNIKINFSAKNNYNAIYKYSTSTKAYSRWQGEDKHIDALTNEQIKVNNIIIQWVPKEKVLDDKGRIELNLVGTGEALIFRDGRQIKGNWTKRNAKARTIFYDNSENEIIFKPGNIWVEIVPNNLKVEID